MAETRAGSPSSLPQATLIVPSRNRGGLLLETIRSVLDGAEVPAEIIIVDQSDARDADLEGLAADSGGRVRYVWMSEPGVSRARNRGIDEAAHDLLVFIDDDVRVSDSWYGTIVRALCASGERGVVTGRVLPESSSEDGGFVPSTITDIEPRVYSGRIWEDVLYSNNMALRRSAFDAAGTFDERLGAGATFRNAEDNDLCFRLLESGHRIHYVPAAVVHHRAWRTWDDYHPLCWSYGYGQGAYYAKHFAPRDLYTLKRLVRDLGHRGRRAIRFRRNSRRALGQFVYMAGLFAGWCRWFMARLIRL